MDDIGLDGCDVEICRSWLNYVWDFVFEDSTTFSSFSIELGSNEALNRIVCQV